MRAISLSVCQSAHRLMRGNAKPKPIKGTSYLIATVIRNLTLLEEEERVPACINYTPSLTVGPNNCEVSRTDDQPQKVSIIYSKMHHNKNLTIEF